MPPKKTQNEPGLMGFSRWERMAYVHMVNHHPINGSRLAVRSGIPRARVYDVLRMLMEKGLAQEVGAGQYVPLPPEELMDRMRSRFDHELEAFAEELRNPEREADFDYVWAIQGYAQIMAKARKMIAAAESEIYIRPSGEEGAVLDAELRRAEKRGVDIKYIAMGRPASRFAKQVVHPEAEGVAHHWGGRLFDLVKDNSEILVGVLEEGREGSAVFNWTENRWFVTSVRDSLRHDFFHYFLHKILEKGRELSPDELALYHMIKDD